MWGETIYRRGEKLFYLGSGHNRKGVIPPQEVTVDSVHDGHLPYCVYLKHTDGHTYKHYIEQRMLERRI